VNIEQLLMLIVALVLVFVIFYISGAIVGQDWSLPAPYLVRVIAVAIVAVVAIPLLRSGAEQLQLGELGVLLAFVILIIVVRFLMVEELAVSDEWLASIAISLVGVVLIYVVDALSQAVFDVRILALF
jgi:hypothetical protein